MKLIAIGDNVTDCYMDEGVYFPGGNAVNVAVNCKKNGAEKVNYIGVFGDDERADYIKQCLTEEGVTYDRSRKVYAHTAQPRVYLKDGDRVFAPGLRDSCQHLFSIKIVKEDEEIIKDYDICHTSCYSNLEYELEELAKICSVSFDFSEKRDEEYNIFPASFILFFLRFPQKNFPPLPLLVLPKVFPPSVQADFLP